MTLLVCLSLARKCSAAGKRVFRAVVLADGDEIGVNEFPQIAVQISGPNAIEPGMPQEATGALSLDTAPQHIFEAAGSTQQPGSVGPCRCSMPAASCDRSKTSRRK